MPKILPLGSPRKKKQDKCCRCTPPPCPKTSEEPKVVPKKNKCYYYPPCIYKDTTHKEYKTLEKPSTQTDATLSGVKLQIIKAEPTSEERLLAEELSHDSLHTVGRRKSTDDYLTSGFGPRRLESLQRMLLNDERRKNVLKYKYTRDTCLEEPDVESRSTSTQKVESSESYEISMMEKSGSLIRLEYLMGITQEPEEEMETPIPKPPRIKVEEEEVETGSAAVRKARAYLRTHYIHQFFQFLMAHLLAERTDQPIDFLVDLLDRCFSYRSGLIEPPLLYEYQHIEQLFYLMDRMRTGFIDIEQYHNGMKTLGIVNYRKNPPLKPSECLIAKDFFIAEAHHCLVLQLDEIIKIRTEKGEEKLLTPPPSMVSKYDTILSKALEGEEPSDAIVCVIDEQPIVLQANLEYPCKMKEEKEERARQREILREKMKICEPSVEDIKVIPESESSEESVEEESDRSEKIEPERRLKSYVGISIKCHELLEEMIANEPKIEPPPPTPDITRKFATSMRIDTIIESRRIDYLITHYADYSIKSVFDVKIPCKVVKKRLDKGNVLWKDTQIPSSLIPPQIIDKLPAVDDTEKIVLAKILERVEIPTKSIDRQGTSQVSDQTDLLVKPADVCGEEEKSNLKRAKIITSTELETISTTYTLEGDIFHEIEYAIKAKTKEVGKYDRTGARTRTYVDTGKFKWKDKPFVIPTQAVSQIKKRSKSLADIDKLDKDNLPPLAGKDKISDKVTKPASAEKGKQTEGAAKVDSEKKSEEAKKKPPEEAKEKKTEAPKQAADSEIPKKAAEPEASKTAEKPTAPEKTTAAAKEESTPPAKSGAPETAEAAGVHGAAETSDAAAVPEPTEKAAKQKKKAAKAEKETTEGGGEEEEEGETVETAEEKKPKKKPEPIQKPIVKSPSLNKLDESTAGKQKKFYASKEEECESFYRFLRSLSDKSIPPIDPDSVLEGVDLKCREQLEKFKFPEKILPTKDAKKPPSHKEKGDLKKHGQGAAVGGGGAGKMKQKKTSAEAGEVKEGGEEGEIEEEEEVEIKEGVAEEEGEGAGGGAGEGAKAADEAGGEGAQGEGGGTTDDTAGTTTAAQGALGVEIDHDEGEEEEEEEEEEESELEEGGEKRKKGRKESAEAAGEDLKGKAPKGGKKKGTAPRGEKEGKGEEEEEEEESGPPCRIKRFFDTSSSESLDLSQVELLDIYDTTEFRDISPKPITKAVTHKPFDKIMQMERLEDRRKKIRRKEVEIVLPTRSQEEKLHEKPWEKPKKYKMDKRLKTEICFQNLDQSPDEQPLVAMDEERKIEDNELIEQQHIVEKPQQSSSSEAFELDEVCGDLKGTKFKPIDKDQPVMYSRPFDVNLETGPFEKLVLSDFTHKKEKEKTEEKQEKCEIKDDLLIEKDTVPSTPKSKVKTKTNKKKTTTKTGKITPEVLSGSSSVDTLTSTTLKAQYPCRKELIERTDTEWKIPVNIDSLEPKIAPKLSDYLIKTDSMEPFEIDVKREIPCRPCVRKIRTFEETHPPPPPTKRFSITNKTKVMPMKSIGGMIRQDPFGRMASLTPSEENFSSKPQPKLEKILSRKSLDAVSCSTLHSIKSKRKIDSVSCRSSSQLVQPAMEAKKKSVLENKYGLKSKPVCISEEEQPSPLQTIKLFPEAGTCELVDEYTPTVKSKAACGGIQKACKKASEQKTSKSSFHYKK